jgi:hypothetical protein
VDLSCFDGVAVETRRVVPLEEHCCTYSDCRELDKRKNL